MFSLIFKKEIKPQKRDQEIAIKVMNFQTLRISLNVMEQAWNRQIFVVIFHPWQMLYGDW